MESEPKSEGEQPSATPAGPAQAEPEAAPEPIAAHPATEPLPVVEGTAHQPTEAAPVSGVESQRGTAEPQRESEAQPEPERREWIGRVVDDRYRVLSQLGEGGMGAVFVAEHLTLHKQVALKVIRAELAGNGDVAARFAREAMATARFEHPHVASAIDYGTLPEGGAYFVMQLVRGRSLRALCTRGKRLEWRRACEICAQVADALSAAKAFGIIHRDLKPDNVLVEQREDGSDLVKVLDFGIAHVAPRETSTNEGHPNRQLTRVGTVMGTPGYMAPEQAIGDKVDHRADLYALGVVLWECISGRELWDGPDLTTVVARQMGENAPRLRDAIADPTLPLELDELVQRLTARAVAERPDQASEVRDTLRKLTHADPGGIRLSVDGLRQAATTLTPHVRTAVTLFRSQPRATQALQTGVVLAALFGVILFGHGEVPPPTTPATPVAQSQAGASAPIAPVAPVADKPLTQQVSEAAANAISKVEQAVSPTPAPPAPPAPPQVPKELLEDARLLRGGDSARERRSAADAILAFRPRERVPESLRSLADFESARSCRERKRAISKMEKQPDPSYLPALKRLSRAPHSGCGFLSLGDCYSCVRGDLRRAIGALGSTDDEDGAGDDKP